MSLPNFNLMPRSIRYNKTQRIITNIDNNEYNTNLKIIEKKFPVGITIYYFSKYGGCLKLKVEGYSSGYHNDNRAYLKIGNTYAYDPIYCKTLQDIRNKKLERILKE